jgi:DNA-binding CsgD family transcriptional regulator
MAEANAARDKRIARLYKEKRLSSYTIADRMGLHPSTVSRVVRRLGLARPYGWHCKPDPGLKPRNDRIERLYREGLTVQQIINRLGLTLTKSPVLNILKARGVPRRQAGSWNPNRPPPKYYFTRAYAARIAPRLGTGPRTSAAVFAKAAGIKVETLRAHLRQLGVRPSTGSGNVRLTVAEVKGIKRLLVGSKRTFASIAAQFDIADNTVNSIAMGTSWKHVPWPGGKTYERRRPRRLFLTPGAPRVKRLRLSRAKRPLRQPSHFLRIGTRAQLKKDPAMVGIVKEIRDSDADNRPRAPHFKVRWKSGMATWHTQAELRKQGS